MDFKHANQAARGDINNWVAEQTRGVLSRDQINVFLIHPNGATHRCLCNLLGKIRDVLAAGALSSSTKLVLVDAIYFKGTWHNKFRKSDTSDAEFSINKVLLINEVTSARLSLYSLWSFDNCNH